MRPTMRHAIRAGTPNVLVRRALALLAALLLVLPAAAQPDRSPAPPGSAPRLDVAFHYGEDPPFEMLRMFDVVVVDPDQPVDPVGWARRSGGASVLYAYTSIGEAGPQRGWSARLPDGIAPKINPVWGSRIIDPADPRWPEFFVAEVIAPAWNRGFRGFFLDTLDAYQALDGDDRLRALRQDGLVRTISLVQARYPQARLIANRGFELMPRIAGQLQAVAAESLYGRWDPQSRRYSDVPEDERQWLLARLREVERRHRLPTIAIEYVDAADRTAARRVAERVLADGVTPWVADGDLTRIGLGALAPVPRRVLLLHDGAIDGDEHLSPAQRLVAMPLQYLGFRVELHDIRLRPLPTGRLGDRYAAVVGWFASDAAGRAAGLGPWLLRILDEGLRVALLNSFGAPLDPALAARLGVSPVAGRLATPLKVVQRDPIVGFEFEPAAHRSDVLPVQLRGSAPALLRLDDARGQRIDGAAITAWGGFAVAPFAVIGLPGTDESRWVVDPIEFLRRAIVDPTVPVPDPTTATGRRVMLVHVDGDGLPSRAELPGTPFAGEVLLSEFIQQYRVPHLVSVIEADVSPTGLYPQWSTQLEAVARRIFAQPNVEIASHTYSHPFAWRSLQEGMPAGRFNLPVPGYRYSVSREIAGSAAYIDARLAPAGKKTTALLWSGDCVPDAAAIAQADDSGLLNMNGGDTTITRREPTLTLVAPMSIRKAGRLQVYAPNQNENPYTNGWSGPFYGMERVIETFELTESPRRLKPINIYYHAYSATKPASVAAMHKVYRWALAQEPHPVQATDWIRAVAEFDDVGIARDLRTAGRWKVATGPALRTLRWPRAVATRIDWARSDQLAGRKRGTDGDYLHLADATAWLQLRPAPGAGLAAGVPAAAPMGADPRSSDGGTRTVQGRRDGAETAAPHLVDANGAVDRMNRQGATLQFRLRSHLPGEMRLVHQQHCRTTVDGRPLIGLPLKKSLERQRESEDDEFSYRLPDKPYRDGSVVSVRC